MYKVAILRDDQPDNSEKWEIACNKFEVDFISVNMLRSDWYESIKSFAPDFCVCRPPGDLSVNKDIFDRKLYYLEKYDGLPCYPGYHEITIYENKAALAWFLKTNDIPHPETFVTADETEALDVINNLQYPVFAKTLIGATGSGIKKINNKEEAESYVNKAFSTGIKRRYGPNRKTGNPGTWFKKALISPQYLIKKLKIYHRNRSEVQKNVVLFQEYIEHDHEWRIARTGESWFGYKKLKVDEMASGAKKFEYGAVPEELLTFTNELCKKHNFQFMAIDVFYDGKTILVNELQTIFGHKSEAICYVDGKPGRYLNKNGKWLFEEGNFNTNESFDLRLQTAINLYQQSYL